jgi:hypothetical protein
MNKTVKYIAIILAIIIVILLGILIFVNPPQKAASISGPMPAASK